jgi:hypothetical protein
MIDVQEPTPQPFPTAALLFGFVFFSPFVAAPLIEWPSVTFMLLTLTSYWLCLFGWWLNRKRRVSKGDSSTFVD